MTLFVVRAAHSSAGASPLMTMTVTPTLHRKAVELRSLVASIIGLTRRPSNAFHGTAWMRTKRRSSAKIKSAALLRSAGLARRRKINALANTGLIKTSGVQNPNRTGNVKRVAFGTLAHRLASSTVTLQMVVKKLMGYAVPNTEEMMIETYMLWSNAIP